jgi:hypothetical protein
VHIRGNPRPEAVEMPGDGASASIMKEPAQSGTGVAALATSGILLWIPSFSCSTLTSSMESVMWCKQQVDFTCHVTPSGLSAD